MARFWDVELTRIWKVFITPGKEEGGYANEEISGFAKKAELSAIITPVEGDELGDAGDYAGVMAPLAASTTCDSCEDCTEKLKSGEYDVVTLTTDITDHGGSCIGLIMGESNVVFDCGGHTIDGDDVAIDPEHGVTMMHGTGNTIKNCVISDFSEGIYLWNATDHKISGNTVTSNGEGIEMGWSDSNTIDGNTVNENYNGIVLSNSNSNTINSNTVCKNTNSDFLIESGTGNAGDENTCDTPKGWNDAGARGCTNTCSGTITCNSCSDCSDKLSGMYDTVTLTTDLTDVRGSCIIFGADNVIFDGDGHKIDSDDTGEFKSGIEMIGKSGNTIRNCVITDFESGITLYGASKNEIYKNQISSNYYDGVWISEESNSNNIRGNQIEDNGKYGIFFSSNSNDNTFSENIVCSNPTDIHDSAENSGDDNRCDITSNWNDDGARGCTHPCEGGCVIPTDDLYINSDTTLCPGFYDIPDAGADGVIIINADGVVLDCNGATINGTGSGYGIYNYGFDNVTVKNGNVMNYRYGIQMRTYADYNTIISNNLSLNTIAGIELFAASYNMIANNTASSNDGWGIYLVMQADNNTVVNNTANSNKVDGIRMEDSSCGNTVRYNLVNSNTANGIHLESASDRNELIRNVASSNEQNGIHLRDRASDNTLTNNSISDNANYGIYFTSDSTDNLVSGNLVCSNSVDIYDEDGNSGDENRCDTTHNWNDAGTTTGCTHTCTPAGSGVCYDYTISSWLTPPQDDDWNVTHRIVCNDTVITLNGDLAIDSGGELGFNNVTLRMNATETETDDYSIEVNSGGAFYINSKDGSPSILTNGDNTTAYYTFHVNSGSQFTMQNSELHNCGYDWKELPNKDAGLWINTDDTLLVNNMITGNYYGGAFFYQSDNHTVVDNTVKLNRWHGIRLIASNGSRIIGNSVESTIDGITLSQSPDCEILNNVVSSNQDGIAISHSSDATIAENIASSNGRYGIRVTSSSDCGMRNNTANSNADGIMVSSSIRAIITGNTADSNRDDGIYLSNSPDSVVMDNTANLNNRAVDIGTGLVVLSSPHTEVELNVVNSNWRGMFIDSSSGCMISENNASDNMWYGIHLNSSRANNLTENVLYSNKGQWDSAGLHLSESEDNRIIGNYATANLHGMVLYKSPNSGIAGNAVDGNDEDGIALDSSDGIEIVENTVTANSVGISLHDSDNVEIIHNNASGNGHTGIALSTSKNNLIIENVAVRNRYGIALSSSSVNEIRNNTATSNNFGMSLRWSSNNNTATSNNFDSSTDYGANLFRVYNNTILHNNFSNSWKCRRRSGAL